MCWSHFYRTIFFFVSLKSTQNSSTNIGRTIDEVFENLLPLGNMYNFELDYDDYYYKLDRTHNVLKYVYNGLYPIHNILSSVTQLMRIFIYCG